MKEQKAIEVLENDSCWDCFFGTDFGAAKCKNVECEVKEASKLAIEALEKQINDGWIPYTTNGELPNNNQRVWLSFTNPHASFVKSAWWINDHFEWKNGKKVKDYPSAWKPCEVPVPYQPNGGVSK